MSPRFAQIAAPVYLIACILLGGSRQGEGANALLQLAGAMILGLAIVAPDKPQAPIPRSLRLIAGALLALCLTQLIPLPAQLWSALPGKDVMVDGFVALGRELPPLPLSLDRGATIGALLACVPPAAMFVLVRRAGYRRKKWLAAALLAATLAAIGVGLLQAGGSRFYLYETTNVGQAVGFFANANHMGALLLVAVPFAAMLLRSWWRRAGNGTDRTVVVTVALGSAAVLLLGIVTNRSLAIVLLSLPVVLVSTLLAVPRESIRRIALPALAAALVAFAGALALASQPAFSKNSQASIDERRAVWAQTVTLIADHGPLGSGFGTFRAVYPLAEDPDVVERTIVNHAHNDYLELVLELGAIGALLILTFLIWFAAQSWRLWRQHDSDPLARAASIAAAALLLHSAVDFPIRTAALGAVFAMCLALLLAPSRRRTRPGLKRAARHVRIEDLA